MSIDDEMDQFEREKDFAEKWGHYPDQSEAESLKAQLSSARDALEAARAENHERYVAGVTTGEAMRNGLMAKMTELRAQLEAARADNAGQEAILKARPSLIETLRTERDEAIEHRKHLACRLNNEKADLEAQLSAARAEVARLKQFEDGMSLPMWSQIKADNTALRAIVGELCDAVDSSTWTYPREVAKVIARARALCGGTP